MALSRAFCLAASVLLLAALATASPHAKEAAHEAKEAKEVAKEAAKNTTEPAKKCVEVAVAPLFYPDSGALYCPHGENNQTGCRPMTNGIDNVFRFAGTNLQQLVKFNCKTEIDSLEFKVKLAQFLPEDAAAMLMVTVNNVFVARTLVTSEFTDKRGERGTLWMGGPFEAPIPGQGPDGDEYVIKLMMEANLPPAAGALVALADKESLAKAVPTILPLTTQQAAPAAGAAAPAAAAPAKEAEAVKPVAAKSA